MAHGQQTQRDLLAGLAGTAVEPGRFGRMFPALRPLVVDESKLLNLARAMVDAAPTVAGDNPGVPAGFTYLGQFIDHDITLDTTSLSEQKVDPLATRNFRTPALDLDSVYGGGPDAQPYLYFRDRARFVLGNTRPVGGVEVPPGSNKPTSDNDLVRSQGVFAVIGDPRNDENLIVAQFHVAMLKFHNKVVELLRAGGPPRPDEFADARRTVLWHYQWIVLNDFLRRILDPAVLDDVLENGRRFYTYGRDAFIPVEFSAAAYRLGHSMVRDEYDFNRFFNPSTAATGRATFDQLFKFTGLAGSTRSIPTNWIIDWQRFFDFPLPPATVPNSPTRNLSRRLDPLVVPAMHTLAPDLVGGAGVPAEMRILPFRNLLRGLRVGLPSGQAVAAAMRIPALTAAELASGPDGAAAAANGLVEATPLWYYILKESEQRQGGLRLGTVGSRILAEVFVGLLEADGTSFLAQAPEWTPTLPSATPHQFTMVDLLTFMGDVNPLGDP